MQIDGFHQLFYLGFAAFIAYVIWAALVWLDIIRSDKLGFKKKPGLHIAIIFIGALLALFQPFKLVNQSGEAREYHRHSFDTSVYQNDRPAVETFNPTNELSQIKQKQEEAKQEWDQLRNNEEQ